MRWQLLYGCQPRTIERHATKVLNFGEVQANTIGRPINSVAMYRHVEFLIMEAVFKQTSRKDARNLSNDDGDGNNAAKQ